MLFSRTCSQKMVRGYIVAQRIRKPCCDSLERRFTRRVSQTIFGDTRLCRKTRTSRILPVSVPLRGCDSYVFMIMKCLTPKLVVLKPDGFEKGGVSTPKPPPLAAPLWGIVEFFRQSLDNACEFDWCAARSWCLMTTLRSHLQWSGSYKFYDLPLQSNFFWVLR